ncbi:uncharacterized protein [Onthophagus taurus]|uniref:uncharacterized protein isoform X2 n=1 Tax=Onthophagus taurus TaxID=166361 RepID=UPI0039BEB73D
MDFDLKEIKEYQKVLLAEEKKRLGLSTVENQFNPSEDPNVPPAKNINETDRNGGINELILSPNVKKQDDSNKGAMFRWGEYSPNNPQLRVTTAPYLGFGEHEQRKLLLQQQRQADYKEHLNNQNENLKNSSKRLLYESKLISSGQTKSVQTDIQDINNSLFSYSCESSQASKECTPSDSNHSDKENHQLYGNANEQRIDQRLTSDQNLELQAANMDKPRSILSNRRTQTPTDHLLSDYNHGYGTSCLDGFSYHDRIDVAQRERLKREAYQQELRMQIEEKRRLVELREEQERIEQERENRRLEQQLIRMQEEQIREEQIRAIRDEQSRRTTDEFLRRQQDLQLRSSFRKRYESESSPLSLRNTNVASKLSHYSPPVSRRSQHHSYTLPSSSSSYPGTSPRYGTLPSRYESMAARRDALNRMDLLGAYHDPINNCAVATNSDYSRFSRFDSLSRIDALKHQDMLNRLETLSVGDAFGRDVQQRRHSATQQDLSAIRKSPKMQRRSSSSRLDDPLPTPVLKAHSPVARELKNSIAVNSSSRPDVFRRYEDKWNKGLVNHGDSYTDGHSRSILTQLGTMRMQLQKEQLRMDETLRQRSSQSKAVNFH